MALFRVEDSDDQMVVHFNDAKILDEGTILATGKELLDMLDRASTDKAMILDFTTVQFMSSAMIGKLVLLNKKAKAATIDLRFRNLTPNVYEVFKLTRLNKVFNIEGV